MLKDLYARWMYSWETRLTSRDLNRIVRPLEWGFDWLGPFLDEVGLRGRAARLEAAGQGDIGANPEEHLIGVLRDGFSRASCHASDSSPLLPSLVSG